MEEKEFDLQAELDRALAEDNAQGVEDVESTAPQTTNLNENEPTQNTKTEQDSYFADMRRKQELDDARAMISHLQSQVARSESALREYFDGNDIDELLDRAIAQAQGVNVETVANNRMREDAALSLQAELDGYRQREIERRMEEDLKAIQSVDPTITSLDDLSETFLRLRFNPTTPMDAKTRFLRTRQIENQQRTPKPASSGSMTSTGKTPNEFFTSDELDRLTSKDLDDPKIMEKAMRSLARLK